jgi:hypothetical protein
MTQAACVSLSLFHCSCGVLSGPAQDGPAYNSGGRDRNSQTYFEGKFHNPSGQADEKYMTHAIEIAQRLKETQALTHYAAHRLATTSNEAGDTVSDIVSISSVAVIESEIAAATEPSETAGAGEQRESPLEATH